MLSKFFTEPHGSTEHTLGSAGQSEFFWVLFDAKQNILISFATQILILK